MGQRSVEGWRARAGYRTHRKIPECGIASGVFTQQAKELFSTEQLGPPLAWRKRRKPEPMAPAHLL